MSNTGSLSGAGESLTRRKRDFRLFWIGQIISSLGSTFTSFALPLLAFKITHSAFELGLTFMTTVLPYLLFGFVIGAWVDRLNRKYVMLLTDILRAATIACIPLLNVIGSLSIWWIYGITFISATLSIGFDAASFAIVPSLIPKEELVAANSRIGVSYSLTSIIGPLLAALLLLVLPVSKLFLGDAFSFLLSAGSIFFILRREQTRASDEQQKRDTTTLKDIEEGLRYIWQHTFLRWLMFLILLVNLVVPTIYAQFVLFAKEVLFTTDSQLSILYTAEGVGVVIVSLMANTLTKKFSASRVLIGSLMLQGSLIVFLALLHNYVAALFLWGACLGLSSLFNIIVYSLGQLIVPEHLLGRVVIFARVITWSSSPLGVLLGSWLIEKTNNVALVYTGIGVLCFLIPVFFLFTPVITSIEQFLPKNSRK